MNDRIIQTIKRAEADEWAKEKFQADIEFSRLPLWRQAVLEGDKLSDGSDDQEYEED